VPGRQGGTSPPVPVVGTCREHRQWRDLVTSPPLNPPPSDPVKGGLGNPLLGGAGTVRWAVLIGTGRGRQLASLAHMVDHAAAAPDSSRQISTHLPAQ